VIALIVHSCYRFAKLGMYDWLQWVIAASCCLVTIWLEAGAAVRLIGAGILGILYCGSWFPGDSTPNSLLAGAPLGIGIAKAPTVSALSPLLVFFLKTGSVAFGSGLVTFAFLEKGLVQQTGWLNEPRVPRPRSSRHAEPWAGCYHGHNRGLLHRRLLEITNIDNRDFLAVVYSDPGRPPDPLAPSRQPKRAGLGQGGLCRCDRHDPRRVHAPRHDRDRRLAHCTYRRRQSRGLVPSGSKQSTLRRHDRGHWVDRLPNPSADHGYWGKSTVASESENRRED